MIIITVIIIIINNNNRHASVPTLASDIYYNILYVIVFNSGKRF